MWNTRYLTCFFMLLSRCCGSPGLGPFAQFLLGFRSGGVPSTHHVPTLFLGRCTLPCPPSLLPPSLPLPSAARSIGQGQASAETKPLNNDHRFGGLVRRSCLFLQLPATMDCVLWPRRRVLWRIGCILLLLGMLLLCCCCLVYRSSVVLVEIDGVGVARARWAYRSTFCTPYDAKYLEPLTRPKLFWVDALSTIFLGVGVP